MAQHDDKATEKEQKVAATYDRARELRRESGFKKMLGDPEMREALWWLLQVSHVNQQPFGTDPYQTAFACGELNVGNRLLARIIETEPTAYITMQLEQAEYDRARNLALARTRDDASTSDD